MNQVEPDSKIAAVPASGARRGALLVNTKSRRGAAWFDQAQKALTDCGMELMEAKAVKKPRELPALVERQIRAGVPIVIVGGGDGTFSSIAHLFARKQTILGVLPLGTGNAFARDLGIQPQVDKACHVILNGKVAQVDMGVIGNREFLNVATVGLSTKIALGLQDEMKKKLGRAVYFISLLRALATVTPFHIKLDLPSGTHEFESLQLVIGNGRFHAGPFQVAPDASIDGGWLSIYALASTRKIDFLKMVIHMRGGRHVDLPQVRAFRVQSGRLSTSPVQRITVDGETKLRTPMDFGIVPRALRVMVPEGFDENS
jgi:diacylglycerol kinase (ATP)